MVTLNFKSSGIEIDLEGLEKIAAMKGKLFIPYDHITNVEENADSVKRYLKAGGTALGYSHDLFGRFTTNDGLGFFVVRDMKKAFAIHLTDEAYKVIVLQLHDNANAVAELRKRIKK